MDSLNIFAPTEAKQGFLTLTGAFLLTAENLKLLPGFRGVC